MPPVEVRDSNVLELCKAKDRPAAFWSVSRVRASDVEPLEGCWSSGWALLWLRTLLSGWAEKADLQAVNFSLPSAVSLSYFFDMKQMK